MSESRRDAQQSDSTERTTDDGRMIKDPVRMIQSKRVQDHFKQVNDLVRSRKIIIEKKKK